MDLSQEITQLKAQLNDIVTRLEALEKSKPSSKPMISTSGTVSRSQPNSATKTKFDHKVYLSTKSSHHYVVGNTYNIRTLLKEKGAKWDGDGKCWKIPEGNIDVSSLQELINGQGLTVEDQNSGSSTSTDKPKKKSKKVEKKQVKSVEPPKVTGGSSGFAMLSESDSD